MVALTRRLAIYVGSLFALLGVYTILYQWGMATFEGESRTWYQSLEIVVQSMTTTGYGQDAPWETVEMTAFVLLLQVTGIAYIVVAIPQFVVPWLETLIEPTPPTEMDHLEDHVIVVGYTDLCDTLVDELEAAGTPYVVLEGDKNRAQQLHEDGFDVLHGDPSADTTLEGVQLEDALAVVVDATERDLVETVLAIESRDPDATVFPLVAEPADARYFRYAGVDEVLSPKHRLGKALGDRVRDVVELDLEDLERGTDLDVREFQVRPAADLFGESVASLRRLEGTGATVLGAWVRGDFVSALPERVAADENTAVLVAGTDADLEAVADQLGTAGSRYQAASDPVLVVGSGLVASTATGTLERADLETTVVDSTPDEAVGDSDPTGDVVHIDPTETVDVVGDPTEEETLREAGIDDAETVVVALEDDSTAILVALTVRALDPALEIIVGATTAASVDPLRTAGATYALALPNVTGRMLTLRLFDHEVMTLEDRLYVRPVPTPALVGEQLSSATIRQETGCTVVGLERDGTVRTDIDGVTLEADDRLLVAGTETQLDDCTETYGDERGSLSSSEADE